MYEFIIIGLSIAISIAIIIKVMPPRHVRQITPGHVRRVLDSDDLDSYVLIDVRKPDKYREGHIPHFKNVPLKNIRKAADILDKNKTVIISSRTGAQGNTACKILKRKGFRKLNNLQGGMSTWRPMKRVK